MTKHSYLASVAATRDVLNRYDLGTKKALGQHFLINDGVIGKICDLAALSKDDTVLEVGPGIGTLTVALLARAGGLIAVERDADLPQVLEETTADWTDTFALVSKDALALTEGDIAEALLTRPAIPSGAPQKFVANLPYAVAATLVLDFFQKFPTLESATIMVQSEVADRMSAQPGTKDYGAYTIKLSLYVDPEERFQVKPGNFFPPPRVDSAVIHLNRRVLTDGEGAPLSDATLKAICTMADAAFATRRKTILNSCKIYFLAQGKDKTWVARNIPHILEQAQIDPTLRGEALALPDFIRLGQAYESTAVTDW